ARPLLVVELVSPNTRKNDVVDKVDHYFRVGVPLYVIVDQDDEDGPLTLRAYRPGRRGYEPIPIDPARGLLLEPFGLRLVVEGPRVVIRDAATGQELGDYAAISEALEAEVRARQQAEQRAEEAAAARQQAEQQAREEAVARQQAEQRAQE